MLEISFYTCLTKTTIIWGTIPEIRSDTTKLFVILGHFLPFYPPSNPENQNFEKMKKESGDVIIFHLCTKNHDQIMYASWDVECYRHFFCHFGPFFALLRHYWHWKLKFGKNVKSNWRYYTFRHVHYKWRSYDVWFLRYWARHDTIFSHFGPFFALIPPNNPKSKFWKKEKDTGR